MKTTTYLLILTLCSCQLLKRNTQSVKTAQEKEEFQLSSQSTLLTQKSELLLVDTSNSQFTLMVWPKGKFTFSLAEGFEGEAEKILVKGKQSAKQLLKIKQSVIRDSGAVKATFTKEKASLTSVDKKKTRIGFNWGWLLIAGVVYLAYWVNKKNRKECNIVCFLRRPPC